MRKDHGLTVVRIKAYEYYVVDVGGRRVGPFATMARAEREIEHRAGGR